MHDSEKQFLFETIIIWKAGPFSFFTCGVIFCIPIIIILYIKLHQIAISFRKNERFHNLLDLGCIEFFLSSSNIYTENIVLGFFKLFIPFDSIAHNVKINWGVLLNNLNTYSYVSIKNSYRIIVLLKGFSKINKNSVLNKSSESEKELLI